MMKILVPGLALAASACATTTPADTPPRCDAGAVQSFVGRAFSPALSGEAQKASGSRTVRVIRPGQAVTMDYREDRLNIELDGSDTVAALRCG